MCCIGSDRYLNHFIIEGNFFRNFTSLTLYEVVNFILFHFIHMLLYPYQQSYICFHYEILMFSNSMTVVFKVCISLLDHFVIGLVFLFTNSVFGVYWIHVHASCLRYSSSLNVCCYFRGFIPRPKYLLLYIRKVDHFICTVHYI